MPQDDLSNITGEVYYSGTSANVIRMMKQIEAENDQVVENVSVTDVDTESINVFQEGIDREIDDRLRASHKVPIYPYFVGAKHDSKQRVFPGLIKEAAVLLTAVRILRSQLYDVNPQQSDSLTQYTDQAELKLKEYQMGVSRIPGAKKRARFRTLSPNMEFFRDPQEVG